MNLSIELDREDDGRWIAEALELPGVMAYGETREEAIGNTERLAIEVNADRIKHGEMLPSACLRRDRPTWHTVPIPPKHSRHETPSGPLDGHFVGVRPRRGMTSADIAVAPGPR